MKPMQKNVLKICLIVLIVALLVMLASTVILIIHDGWEAFKPVYAFPSVGMFIAIIALLVKNKKDSGK